MKASTVTLAALFAVALASDPIPYASQWKYYDQGSLDSVGSAWHLVSYDDSDWETGTAPFGYGSGVLATATTVDFGPNSSRKFITSYYRKIITTSIAAGQINLVRLSLVADDGAVVYINGVEVARFNMPEGDITFETPAASGVGQLGYEDATEYSFESTMFVDGDNVFAVEIHQQSGSSSDMRFDLLMGQFVLPSTSSTASSTNTGTSTRTATPSPTPLPNGPEQLKLTSTWLYDDTGVDQGTAWRASNFNDNGWTAGRAPFGYGESFVTTTIDFGGNSNDRHITYYFRNTFSFTRAKNTNYAGFVQLLADDGWVGYCNGVEFARFRMPEGDIAYETLATVAVSGADETAFDTAIIPDSLIVGGTNTIAIEVHQSDKRSSDVSFEMSVLVESAEPSVTPSPSVSAAPSTTPSASRSGTPAPAASPDPSTTPTASTSPPPSTTPSPSSPPSASPSAGAPPSASSSNTPAPSTTPSSTPAPSPSRSPAASPAAGASPSSTPAASPAAASSVPGASASSSPAPAASSSPSRSATPAVNGNEGGVCACTCDSLTCCGDEIVAMTNACNSSDDSGGSNVLWPVVIGVVGVAAVAAGAYVFVTLKKSKDGKDGKGGEDVEAGAPKASRRASTSKGYASLMIEDSPAYTSAMSHGGGRSARSASVASSPDAESVVSGAPSKKSGLFSGFRSKKSGKQSKSYATAETAETEATETTAPPAQSPSKKGKKGKKKNKGAAPELPPVSDDVINAYLKARGANITVQQLEKLAKRTTAAAPAPAPGPAESEEDMPSPGRTSRGRPAAAQPQGVFPRFAGGGQEGAYDWERESAGDAYYPPGPAGQPGYPPMRHGSPHVHGPPQHVAYDQFAPQARYQPAGFRSPHNHDDAELMAHWDAAVGDYRSHLPPHPHHHA